MIYEFRYGGHTYDIKTTNELHTTVEVNKHAEEIKRKYNLPYVTVSERRL